MYSLVLKTGEFKNQHFAENIVESYKELIEEFQLAEKNITLVTDNATNMIAAAEMLDIKRLPCIAHRIQRLIMHDMFKNPLMYTLCRLVSKMSRIQTALLYKHRLLQQISNELFQNRLANALIHFNEVGKLFIYLILTYFKKTNKHFPFI